MVPEQAVHVSFELDSFCERRPVSKFTWPKNTEIVRGILFGTAWSKESATHLGVRYAGGGVEGGQQPIAEVQRQV